MEDSASRLNEGPHQRLKILFIPMWYPDDDDPSAGVFIQEHARAAALFNDVRVLFVKADRSLRDDSVTDSTEDGIMVRRVRYSTWRATDALGARLETVAKGKGRSGAAARYAATFLRGARSAALSTHTALAYRAWLSEDWKPDVIHAHIYGAGFPAVFIGKICSTPVVVSEHLSTLAEEKLNWFEKFKAGFVARRADAALPVSPILAEELAHLGARNVTIIPNVVDIGDEGTTEEPVAPVGALAITSSGDVKGLDVLVESVEAVSRERSAFRLTVVGAQAADFGPREELARRLEEEGTVRFLGRVPKEEVFGLLRRCDFLLHPTLFETFGLATYEAIFCGKPVVTTDITVFEEFEGANVGVFVEPGSTRAFTEGIMRMLDTRDDYDPEGYARTNAHRYSYYAVGEALDEIYRRVAGGY